MREERLQTPSGWTNALPFEVGDLPELRELEPNDDAAHAMAVTVPVTINGRMDRPGDVDSFRFKTKKSSAAHPGSHVQSRRISHGPYLRILDSDGNVVQENDDERERNSRIDRTFDSADEYVVQIRTWTTGAVRASSIASRSRLRGPIFRLPPRRTNR